MLEMTDAELYALSTIVSVELRNHELTYHVEEFRSRYLSSIIEEVERRYEKRVESMSYAEYRARLAVSTK